MSLLDDVSIVVTPNGYKAGELYAVIPVPTEGAEEITNGDFATDSDWSKGGNWSIGGGVATANGNSNGNIAQSVPLTVGTAYSVTYTVVNASAGSRIGISTNATSIQIERTTDGTYTETFTASLTSFYIRALWNDGNPVSLDNVSVKEWTGADMDVTRETAATRVDENGLVNYAEVLGSELVTNRDFATDLIGWTFANTDVNNTIVWNSGRADMTADGTTALLLAQGVFEVGKTYKIELDAYNITGAGFKIYDGGTVLIIQSDGHHTVYHTALTTALNIYRYDGGQASSGEFDNVSVKEVTRDNVPRIDYTGGGCPHILAEPESTNLYKNYNLLSAIGAGAVSLNNSISPDGTQNATKLTFGSGLNDGALLSIGGSPCVASTVYTFSFYAKSVVGDGQFNLRIDTNSQSVLVGQGFTTTTDWVRYTHTFTSDAAATSFTSNSRFRKVTASNEILFYGMQLEKLSYSTSIIPTSGSTLTRNQDIFTRDGIGSLINSTEGTFFAEISKPIDTVDAYQLISLNNNTANSDRNSVTIGFTLNTNKLFIRVKSSGSNVFQSSNQVSNADTFYKVAISYKSGASKIYVDGSSITPNSGNISGTFTFDAILDKLSFDYNGNNGLPFFGKVKQLQVYDTALTDGELELLTGAISYGSFNELAGADGYTII